ncbi:hypothetical protein [Melittangium boletus]|uniref:hypothetical protein n=1 Tax=Melittangium boletus TaxID=83453 RepID=UPI0012FD2E7E|nr:hypothetical protein [Melittangium boletus]
MRELVTSGLVELSEQPEAVGTTVVEIEHHLVGGEENGDLRGLDANRVRHSEAPLQRPGQADGRVFRVGVAA